jgi:hypothetical protein
VRELFIWKDKGQPAIHTVTDLDMTFDELKERHGMAKDHDESLGFLSRPFNPLGLGIAKEEGTKIVTYVPELLDNLVQDMHHDM